MHAIIETGGKQYRVAPGEVIRVEKLAGDVGSEIELPVKLAFEDSGEPVSGGAVKATIVGDHLQTPVAALGDGGRGAGIPRDRGLGSPPVRRDPGEVYASPFGAGGSAAGGRDRGRSLQPAGECDRAVAAHLECPANL